MNTSSNIVYFDEPKLTFGTGQNLESPKDGLFLFGPLKSNFNSGGIRVGVIGTAAGIKHFERWAESIQGHIPAVESQSAQHRPFPGFSAVFGLDFPGEAFRKIEVTDAKINEALFIADRHQAIFKTVDVFADPIAKHIATEDAPVDLWIVLIPDRVYEYGRPQSIVPKAIRVEGEQTSSKKIAKELINQRPLFAEDDAAATPYYYELNFHNQMKARLLEGKSRAVIQIVRESTIAPHAFLNAKGEPSRKAQDPATVAWNLCTTAYFKTGRRPWKLAGVRAGVCYIGLVFKKIETGSDESSACCGAQMFLDSGEGMVFRGAVGPWRSARAGEYHLSREAATNLISLVVRAYKDLHGTQPRELFIHGKTFFNDDEWKGFQDAVSVQTNIVCVRIQNAKDLKIFRFGRHPMLRGTALIRSAKTGYLWTRGYIPYFKTYPGRETPTPLRIDIVRGEASLQDVMRDVFGLTKLNFNACIYGDGQPVTLRFADSVGEILTAGPTDSDQAPLPFKHYI